MKIDEITGLSINGKTYNENVVYNKFRAPTFLLEQRFKKSNAFISISKRGLEITYAVAGKDIVGKLAAKGKAITKEKDKSIATDFRIKKIVEVSYSSGNGSSRTLVRRTAEPNEPVSFNQSYKFLAKSPRDSQLSTFAPFGSLNIAEGLSVNPFTEPSLKSVLAQSFGKFNSAFKGTWWSPVYSGQLV
jgi:hypothetical protein